MREVSALDWLRAHEEGPRAHGSGPAHFLEGRRDVLQRHDRGPAEPGGGRGAVVGAPVVVGPAAGHEQVGVVELAPQELARNGGVQDLHPDPIGVHVFETARRAVARRLRPVESGRRLGRGGKVLRGHWIALVGAPSERLALDLVGPAFRTLDHPGGVAPIRGVDALLPEVRGLHLVRVGVDDVDRVTHRSASPIAVSVILPHESLDRRLTNPGRRCKLFGALRPTGRRSIEGGP